MRSRIFDVAIGCEHGNWIVERVAADSVAYFDESKIYAFRFGAADPHFRIAREKVVFIREAPAS